MLWMIFQYDWELVLIQRILIGFKAILEKTFTVECIVFVNVKIRAQVAVGSYAVFSHTACSIYIQCATYYDKTGDATKFKSSQPRLSNT